MLAQTTDDGIGLDGIFDSLKVDLDKYEDIIHQFSELNLESSKYSDKNGYKWNAIAESIKGCDETALSYFKTLDDGNGTINNQSASVEGLSAHLKATGKSFNFAAVKATLLNTALNAGIFLVASLAIQGIAKALDNYIHRVEKANEATQEAIDTFKSITSEVESLEDKFAELNEQRKSLDPITDAEDIENLKLETEELNTQLAILKEKQRIAESDADKAAQRSLGMTETSRYQIEERESAYGGVEVGAAYVTKDEELLNAIRAYEEYKTKVDEANKVLTEMSESQEYTQKEWNEQEQIVATYSARMEEARSHANELRLEIDEQVQGLNGNTEASKKLLDTVNNATAQYDEWLDAVNGTTVALQEQSEAEGEVSEIAKDITFDQAWADSFTSENDAVKELGNNLLELAEQGRLTIETFNNADSTGYFKNLGISADEAISKINKLVDESKQLSSMSGQISAMSDALNTKLEDDPDKDDSAFSKLYKAWNAYYGNIGNNVEEINKTLSHHLVMEHTQKMNEEVNRFISNSNIVNNNKPSINIGDIHVTCPGVTSKEVAQQVGVELNNMFNGLHLNAYQQSMMR